MKKIILLFFTFLGICSCYSQDRAANRDTGLITQRQATNILPLKNDSTIKEKPWAKIFPNPTKNKIEIEVKGFEPGYIKIQLLNNTGKIIKEEKRLLLTGIETIIFMFAEISGLYYLLLKQGTRSVKNKLIVQ